MARKKGSPDPGQGRKTKTEEFDLDFDFDDELDGLADAGIEERVAGQKAKTSKREAVGSVFKGAISGAKDTVFSQQNLRTLVTSALPDEYDVILSKSEEVATHASAIVRDAAKELKPAAGKLSKILDKMSDKEDAISKKLARKLESAFGIYESQRVSEAKMQEQAITASLAEVFGRIQAETEARAEVRDTAKTELTQQVEQKRFSTQFGALGNIERNTGILAQYQSQVTGNYQKKSLELQYRSYFAMADLLNKSREHFETNKAHMEAIVKNTALPEYVKLQQSERFMEMARNRAMDKFQSSLFGGSSPVVNGFQALNKVLIDKGREMSAAFMEGMDMYESTKEMSDSMGGNKYELAGEVIGGHLAKGPSEKAAHKLGAWAKSHITKDPRIEAFGKKYVGYAMNPQALAYDWQKTLEERSGTDGPGFIGDLFQKVLKEFAKDTHGRSAESLRGTSGLTKGDVAFDRRFYTSVTDIIPGYLARILAQTEKTATSIGSMSGTKPIATPELQRYDYKTGKFLREGRLKTDLRARMAEVGQTGDVSGKVQAFIRQVGLDRALHPDQQAALQQGIVRWLLAGNPLTLKATQSGDFKKLLPPEHRSAINKALESLVRQSGNMSPGDATTSIKSSFDIAGDRIKRSIPNLYGEAQSIYTEGHGDLLESMGITSDTDGRVDIGSDVYAQLTGVAKSDIHSKSGLRPSKPGSVLDKISSMLNYSWEYKHGEGTPGGRFGPTAQAVNSKFGNYAAPGGTKIDLVSMNGINMQAIKDLNQKVDHSLAAGSGSGSMFEVMKAVEAHTLRTAIAVEGLDRKFFMGFDLDTDGIKSKLGIFARMMKNKASEGLNNISNAKDALTMGPHKPGDTSIGGQLLDFARSPSASLGGSVGRVMAGIMGAGVSLVEKTLGGVSTALGAGKEKVVDPIYGFVSKKLSDDNMKDSVKTAAGNLITGAWGLANQIYSGMSDLVKNKIPAGLQAIWDRTTALGRSAAELLDPPVDIYVVGESEPRIKAQVMRMNGYIDVASGKPITRPGMISGPVALLDGTIVLSSDDIMKGVVDHEGNEIMSIRARAIRFLRSKGEEALGRAQNAFKFITGGLKKGASAIGDRVGSVGSGLTGGRSYDVLVDIRDILHAAYADRLPSGFSLRSMVTESSGPTSKQGDVNKPTPAWKTKLSELSDSVKDRVSAAKEQISSDPKYRGGNAISTMFGLFNKTMGRDKKQNTDAQSLLDQYLKGRKPDTDTKGDRDEKKTPSWKTRFGDLADRANERRKLIQERLKPVKNDPKYRGGNVIDMLTAKASAAKDAIMDFFSVGESLGDLPGGKKTGPVGRAGGRLGGALATGAARGAAATGTALKIGAGIGKVALPALGSMAVTGLSTAGSAGMSILAALAGANVGTLAAGALALGAVGYAGYRLYKYISSAPEEIDRIRLAHYGAGSDLQHHHRTLMSFEQMVQEKAQLINEGDIKINGSKLDWMEVASLFNIDPKSDHGQEMMTKLYEWFYSRFVPVYITHRKALYQADSKLKVNQYNKLTGQALAHYLGTCDVPAAIFSIKASPFPDVQGLRDTKNEAAAIIKSMKDKAAKASKTAPIAPPVQDKGQAQTDKSMKAAADALEAKSAETAKTVTAGTSNLSAAYQSIRSPDDEPAPSVTPAPNSTISPQKPKVLMTALSNGERADGYMVLQKGVNLDGVHPLMLERLRGMVQEYGEMTGKSVVITDGKRTREQQMALFKSKPGLAAYPGTSLHEAGLAIDADREALAEMEEMGLMRKYGFTRPVGKEPWHMEQAGIQADINRARTDQKFATEMISLSAYRGGGGYGLMSDVYNTGRNPKLAHQLFSQDGIEIEPSRPPVPGEIKPPVVAGSDTQSGTGAIKTATQATMAYGAPKETETGTGPGVQYGGTGIRDQSKANDTRINSPTEVSNLRAESATGIQPLTGTDVNSIRSMLRDVAGKTGVEPSTMEVMAAIESDFKPNAKAGTSSAGGLFQFIDSTWKSMLSKYGSKYGLKPDASKFDPVANAYMAAEYIKENNRAMRSVVDTPTPGITYAAHFLGPGGAKTLYKADPNQPAASVLPAAASANKPIFYANGSPRSVSEVQNVIESKVTKKAQVYGIPMPVSGKVEDRFASVSGTPTDAPKPSTEGSGIRTRRLNPAKATGPVTPAETRQAAAEITTSPSSVGTIPKKPVGVPVSSIHQGSITAVKDVAGLNSPSSSTSSMLDVLNKSYDVQSQMLTALTTIAEKVGSLSVTQTAPPSAPQSGSQPQQPKIKTSSRPDVVPNLPIDLRRVSA